MNTMDSKSYKVIIDNGIIWRLAKLCPAVNKIPPITYKMNKYYRSVLLTMTIIYIFSQQSNNHSTIKDRIS